MNHHHGIRKAWWILEAAEMETGWPRQVPTDPGRAVLQEGQASGSTLRKAPSSFITNNADHELGHGLVAGLVLHDTA